MTKIPLSVYVEAIKQPRNGGGCDCNCRSRNTDLCSATTCSNYPPLPYCAEPDDGWPPQINACLREILRYRKQQLDPEGYRKELADASLAAKSKKIKGAA
jgi:hypothetical protein